MNLKHVGYLKSTGRKVLVVFRTLPGESDAALVVQTENLTDDQHDALIQLVESPSGQAANEFADVLARATFSNGSTMLATLHVQRRLTKVRTSDVVMKPNLHSTIGLDELNQLIAEQRGISVNDLAIGNQSVTEAGSISDVPKQANPNVVAESEVANVEPHPLTDAELAAKYRADADGLLAEAARLQQLADTLNPLETPEVVSTESAPTAIPEASTTDAPAVATPAPADAASAAAPKKSAAKAPARDRASTAKSRNS